MYSAAPSSSPSTSTVTATNSSSNKQRRFKRSAAGYPRASLLYDMQEEQQRVQRVREEMYRSLGLESSGSSSSSNNNSMNNGMNHQVKGKQSVVPMQQSSYNHNNHIMHQVQEANQAAAAATTQVPKKRKPGRPRGSKNITSKQRSNNNKMKSQPPSKSSQLKRKRGRKPGSKNKKSSINNNVTPSDNISPTLQTQSQPIPLTNIKQSTNTAALQKFYDSSLLSSDEEKLYGRRVQYLMRCEEVHEALVIEYNDNNRWPSMQQWAEACGYVTESDVEVVEGKEVRALRPVEVSSNVNGNVNGSHNSNNKNNHVTMDTSSGRQYNTNIPAFVGSVTAGTGVGRGKGRAKKVPRGSLDEIFLKEGLKEEDMEGIMQDFKSMRSNSSYNDVDLSRSRGTVHDFIEDLKTARSAKKQMVKSNMRLVISIARRYQKVGVNLQDLVQEGSLGLMRATEKYDPSRGFKFSTYASWWIQQAVFRAIAYHSRTIRLPVHVHNLLNRARKVRSELQAELGRVPLDKEIAEKLNMTPEKLTKMLLMTRKSISLEQPRYRQNPKDLSHESEMMIGDAIDGSSSESRNSGDKGINSESNPEAMVDNELFHADLEEMLTILGDDETRVIRLRYGMDDGMTRTVSTVSEIMNKPKSWVRSQECRALRKLRRPWYEKKLKEHQNSFTS